ncbi:hypothetical protein Egran_05813 [Elaphomyces granulatus]|uniref:Uncharacterized protein n=1 Tax=Elaphomyces granulatus TaxID=519963 RepID=A0A232LQK7_9EURO|nr:hypothetical protein Egran_05813 [Elaphomyces granulatus]
MSGLTCFVGSVYHAIPSTLVWIRTQSDIVKWILQITSDQYGGQEICVSTDSPKGCKNSQCSGRDRNECTC